MSMDDACVYYDPEETGLTRGPWREERDRIQARVIEDSTTDEGVRLTTMEVTIHRFVLAELNTHRTFSRNSESSRAVPFAKRVEKVRNSPAIPISFPAEQRGMSGGAELEGEARVRAQYEWEAASREAALAAIRLAGREEWPAETRVHKSIPNRMLEPYLWHTVVITATEWAGFFHQRCHPAAQPEIRVAAECMAAVLNESRPWALAPGEWHTPFVEEDEQSALSWVNDPYGPVTRRDIENATEDAVEEERYPGEEVILKAHERGISVVEALKQLSAARCARASYVLNREWDIEKDFARFDKLTTEQMESGNPVHWSPLEHVATPCWQCAENDPLAHPRGAHEGNFRGWKQFRHEMDASPYV